MRFSVLDYRIRLSKDSLLTARDERLRPAGSAGQWEGRIKIPVNDGVRTNDYAANLNRLVDKAEQAGAEALFVLLPHPFDLTDEGNTTPAWTLYRNIMRDVASSRGAPLVDMVQVFQDSGYSRQELFFDEGKEGIQDDLHPTGSGHRIMGQAVAEALSEWSGGKRFDDSAPREAKTAKTRMSLTTATRPRSLGPEGPTATVVTGTIEISGFKAKSIQIDAVVPNVHAK